MSRALYYDTNEAAALLGVHRHTVRAWAKNGTLPAKRLGRRVLIPREAVEPDLVVRVPAGMEHRAIRVEVGGATLTTCGSNLREHAELLKL